MNPVEASSTSVVALLLDDRAAPRLGTLLRHARKQRSLTRREVAARVGTTSNDLRRYERGSAPVPPGIFVALAECYGGDLTAQLATRVPIEVDPRRIVVGPEESPLESHDDDEVLGAYVGIVARLRQSKPGEPIALRTGDLIALSTALGHDPDHVEARIVELLGCTPQEARSLHTELLRRKLVLPVAGLVTGLAVVTGVGVAAASTGSVSTHANHTQSPAVVDSPAPTAEPTSTTVAPPVEPAAAPTTVPATTVPPAPAAAAAVPTEVAPQAEPASAPVIAPDDTPVGIPANETVTIIIP